MNCNPHPIQDTNNLLTCMPRLSSEWKDGTDGWEMLLDVSSLWQELSFASQIPGADYSDPWSLAQHRLKRDLEDKYFSYTETEKRRPNSPCSTWCSWPCARAVNGSPPTSVFIHLFWWEATWLPPNISHMWLRCTSVGEGLFQPFHS